MRGTEVYKLLGGAASQITSEANASFLKQYHYETNDMFARLHAAEHNSVGSSEYEAERQHYMEKQKEAHEHSSDPHLDDYTFGDLEYTRYTFKRRSEADYFVSEMRKQNVEVTVAPVRVNGQIMVEIPKEMKLYNEDGTVKKRANGDDIIVQTAGFVREYENSTGLKVNQYSYYNDYGDAKQKYTQETLAAAQYGIVENEILNGVPEIAGVYRVLKNLEYAASKYGDTDQKHAFTSTLRHDGDGEKVGGEWSGITNSNQVKATVMNNSIVIIDGKMVTDPETVAAVLGQHQRRSELVREYAQQYADVSQALAHSSATAKPALTESSAAESIPSSPVVTENARRTNFRFSETNDRIATNARDIGLSINKQTYAVGGYEHGVKHGRFSEGVLGDMRNDFGTQAIMLQQAAGCVTVTEEMLVVLNKTALNPNINLTQTQKDFLTNLSSRISESGNNLMFTYEEKINMVDIVKSAQDYSQKNHSFLTDAEKDLLGEMNTRAEAGGRFRLSKEEMVMFDTNIKKQLDALQEDLGIDLHFVNNRKALTVTQNQLCHININLESELAKHGITFNNGRFIDGAGQALGFDEMVKALASTQEGIRDVLRVNRFDMMMYDRTGDIKWLGKNLETQFANAKVEVISNGTLVSKFGTDISEFDILKMDKAFLLKAQGAGYNFITAAGTFDVKSLMNLSDADLKNLKAVGISETTVNVMKRFHKNDGSMLKQLTKRGAASWGNSKHQLRRTFTKKGVGITSKLTGGSKLVGEGDQESQQAMQTFQTLASAPDKVKTAAAYTKQFGTAVGQRVDAFKEKHSGFVKNDANSSKTPKNPAKTKKANKAAAREANPEKLAKKIKRDEKRLTRMQKSKVRMEKIEKFVHKFDLKDRAKQWFMTQTAVGRAIAHVMAGAKAVLLKVAGTFLAVYFKIAAMFAAVVIVISMIQSLSGLPFKGLKKLAEGFAWVTGQKPAVITLYEYMDEIQAGWLGDLNDYGVQYGNLSDINYTLNYTDADSYFAGINDLYKDGDDLYINPFYKGGNADTDAMTYVERYDGRNDTVIMANPSVYGMKNTDGTASVENGHTNNIKDILAMVDVNYQFDLGTCDDDSLQSILGEEPAVIWFENVYNKTTGWLKWAGKCVTTFFGNLIGEDKEYPSLDDYWGGTVAYGTIQNYCDTLYRSSHQEQVSLDVEYYPMNSVSVNIEGTMEDITNDLSQENASWLGVCNSPVEKDYKIAWNGEYTYPYILDESGNKIDLSKASNTESSNVRLTLDYTNPTGHLSEGEESCLWDGMGENKETYDKIVSYADSWFDKCWDEENKNEDYESYSATSDWYDSEHDAKENAVNQVKAKSDEYKNNPPAVEKEFTLSSDRNSFVRIWKEGCYKDENVTYEEQQVEDGTEWVDKYDAYGKIYDLYIDNGGKIVIDGNSYGTDNPVQCYYDDDGNHHIKYKINGSEYDTTNEDTYRLEVEREEVTKYKTQYKATCTANVLCTHTETYKRDCKGHEFTYCGGHVACHVKGIVYSATNEQMALGGMYSSEDQLPVAKNFDMSERGYEQIRGKVIKDQINYDSAQVASTTGGCKSPIEDVQGSDVNRGLNLYVKENGDLDKGMQMRGDLSPQVFRDIFDIDSAIDKGGNVFPWKADEDGKRYTSYEGWTADNIQYVAMRLSIDWNDVYGIDIPYELGGVTISEEDIELLNDALAKEYGDAFTETRKDAVDWALRWVDRGHYSTEHDNHYFLDEFCSSVATERMVGGETFSTRFNGNCTAGSSLGFAMCYMHQFDKVLNGWQPTSSVVSSCLPADVIRHNRVSQNTAYSYEYSEDDLISNGCNDICEGILELTNKDTCQIYIGTLTKIFEEQGVDVITLQNGYVIRKGVPITVDLSQSNSNDLFNVAVAANSASGSGTIFFRSENSDGYGKTEDVENFYWLEHGTVDYIKFE